MRSTLSKPYILLCFATQFNWTTTVCLCAKNVVYTVCLQASITCMYLRRYLGHLLCNTVLVDAVVIHNMHQHVFSTQDCLRLERFAVKYA